jgi:hypothetical protein
MERRKWKSVDPKDPQASRFIQWDLSDDVTAESTVLVAAVITEVDCNDAAVTTPTVTIGTPVVNPGGYVTALVSGGTVCTNVYLRCAYELANGVTDHATILLPIQNR